MSASLTLFEKEHAAREKYIYFICGVASALAAYFGKDYVPKHPLSFQDEVTIWALSCLIAAFMFGAVRILLFIEGTSINKDILTAEEESANFVEALKYQIENKDKGVPISINKQTGKLFTKEELGDNIKLLNTKKDKDKARMEKWFNWSTAAFIACHVFLISGFALLIFSKFAQ